jgi:P27 family predicted phage terminase small subunit
MTNTKIPASRKRTRGTLRADRTRPRSVSERLVRCPSPPQTLSKGAVAEWLRLAPVAHRLGVLSGADLRSFELLCETLGTEKTARLAIEHDGMTIKTEGGGQKAHPGIRVMETARAQAARLLADFGLNPKSRNYVSTAPLRSKNAFDALDRQPASDASGDLDSYLAGDPDGQ